MGVVRPRHVAWHAHRRVCVGVALPDGGDEQLGADGGHGPCGGPNRIVVGHESFAPRGARHDGEQLCVHASDGHPAQRDCVWKRTSAHGHHGPGGGGAQPGGRRHGLVVGVLGVAQLGATFVSGLRVLKSYLKDKISCMKHFFLSLSLGMAALAGSAQFGTAPDFNVTDLDGNTHQLYADILDQGLIAVIDVSATWCGPCKTLKKTVESIEDEYENIEFLFLNILLSYYAIY